MALKPKMVQVVFTEGLDQHTDSKLTTKLTTLENAVFKKSGSISKRNGYTNLSSSAITPLASTTTSGSLLTCGSLDTFGDELLTTSDNSLWSFSEGWTTTGQWINRGQFRPTFVSTASVIDNNYIQSTPDLAEVNHIRVFVWEDSRGGIRACVKDTQTGTNYLSDASISTTGVMPKCITIGNYIYVYYIETSTLKVRRLNTTNPYIFTTAITVASVRTTSPRYDVANYNSSFGVLVYASTTAATDIICYVDQTGAIASAPAYNTVSQTSSTGLALSVNSSGNVLIVCSNNTNGIRGYLYDATLSSVWGPTSIDSFVTNEIVHLSCVWQSASVAWVVAEYKSSNTYDHFTRTTSVTSAGVVGTPSVLKRSVGLATEPFVYAGTTYVNLVHDTDLQPSYFTTTVSGYLVGKHLYGQAGGLVTTSGCLSSVIVDPDVSTKYWWAAGKKSEIVSSDVEGLYSLEGVSELSIDFDNDNIDSVEAGNSTIFTGSIPSLYDGASISELGFLVAPENVSYTQSATGGYITQGVYSWCCCYEWTDAQGQTHRSSPSAAVQKTVPGGTTSSFAISIPPPHLTNKSTAIGAAIYRTESNGTRYFRLNDIGETLDPGDGSALTYTDVDTDTTITTHEVLYTDGDKLPNDPPPPCKLIATGKNRVFLAGLETPSEIRYSKSIVYNEGVAFTDWFYTHVDKKAGPITAIAVLDDKVIVFTATHIYGLTGDGPEDTGVSGKFTDPQQITSDVGCIDSRSVVLVPFGLMFQSHKGIYALSRDLATTYVGAPVEDYNSQTITAATLVQDKSEVRFLTDSGYTLVFNYLQKQWSTFTNYEGIDAEVWQNYYTFATSSGVVHQENTGYLDGSSPITLKVRTGWIKPGSIQGYARIWRAYLLGEFKSDHDLHLQEAINYDSDVVSNLIWDIATVVSGTDSTYQLRAHLPKQRAEAVQFTLYDENSTGESMNLSHLQIECAVEQHGMRTRSEKDR